MNAAKLLLSLALLAVLAACASNPKLRYYTLVPPVDANTPKPRLPASVDLLPVKVAAQADYPQLVLREGAERFTLVENRLWVAPLPEEFRAALLARLATALQAPIGDERVRIAVEVSRMDAVFGRYALLEANWELKGKKTTLVCSTRSSQTVGEGFDALVAGHQRTAQALADDIGRGLLSLSGPQPSCPASL